MSEFRLNIDVVSKGALPNTMDALSRRAADLPETQFLSAWKAPDGEECLFMRGPSEEAVIDIVEECGINVSSVAALSQSDSLEPDYSELFPGRKVWCSLHGGYHTPPSCQ